MTCIAEPLLQLFLHTYCTVHGHTQFVGVYVVDKTLEICFAGVQRLDHTHAQKRVAEIYRPMAREYLYVAHRHLIICPEYAPWLGKVPLQYDQRVLVGDWVRVAQSSSVRTCLSTNLT